MIEKWHSSELVRAFAGAVLITVVGLASYVMAYPDRHGGYWVPWLLGEAEEVECRKAIEERVYSPATLTFQDVTGYESDSEYQVSAEFDAENKAGALVRSEVTCVFERSQGSWSLREVKDE